ncbi:hypothetical protein FE783_35005 [Paenibacillus mesophilus]|nr:hypothetical protein FE783_35005 [Paenibacillus mesophilus]
MIGAGKAGAHFIKLLRNFEVPVLVYDPLLQQFGSEVAQLECKNVQALFLHKSTPLTGSRTSNRRQAAGPRWRWASRALGLRSGRTAVPSR